MYDISILGDSQPYNSHEDVVISPLTTKKHFYGVSNADIMVNSWRILEILMGVFEHGV